MEHASDHGLKTTQMLTDRPGEQLLVHHLDTLPAVQLWTVKNSDRLWAMHHETYTACLVLAPGQLRATWRYRGRERMVSAQNVQLMEPGELHVTTSTSEPASFFVIWWQPTYVEELARELDYRGTPHLRTCQTADPTFVAGLIDAYCAVEVQNSLAVHSAVLRATGLLIERCALGNGRKSSIVKFHPGVAKARGLLNSRYAERVTLDELANAAGLSKFHLVRSFTQECGLAPHAYQNLRRVVDAKLRIEQGQSITEAATSNGFADQAHFSRVFKRLVGVPPGAWSKAVRPTKAISCPHPGG
ncbi:MAG TPA: AraC family transcriptional regulator [Polyangiaceae bacterium]|nr:AraC family transcriptional regulator [Polyangiaceae bacterium]